MYQSAGIEVDLGRKDPEFDVPSYGRAGVLRGTISLRKTTNVKRVVVKVSFPTSFSMMQLNRLDGS